MLGMIVLSAVEVAAIAKADDVRSERTISEVAAGIRSEKESAGSRLLSRLTR